MEMLTLEDEGQLLQPSACEPVRWIKSVGPVGRPLQQTLDGRGEEVFPGRPVRFLEWCRDIVVGLEEERHFGKHVTNGDQLDIG